MRCVNLQGTIGCKSRKHSSIQTVHTLQDMEQMLQNKTTEPVISLFILCRQYPKQFLE